MTFVVGKTEIVIQDTMERKVGERCSVIIKPDDIHIMAKEFDCNRYDGYITKKNTVCFADGEFACDVTQLYEGSHLDEEGYLITADGEKIDLTDVDVSVEVGLKDVEIIDTRRGRRRLRHDNSDSLQRRPLSDNHQNGRRGRRFRSRYGIHLERKRQSFG